MIRLIDPGDSMARGGSREGAGRKPASEAGASVVFSARIPPDLDDKVTEFMTRRGLKRADVLATALRMLIDSDR